MHLEQLLKCYGGAIKKRDCSFFLLWFKALSDENHYSKLKWPHLMHCKTIRWSHKNHDVCHHLLQKVKSMFEKNTGNS